MREKRIKNPPHFARQDTDWRTHHFLGAQGTLLQCLSSLVLPLSPVQGPQVLQRCCHCGTGTHTRQRRSGTVLYTGPADRLVTAAPLWTVLCSSSLSSRKLILLYPVPWCKRRTAMLWQSTGGSVSPSQSALYLPIISHISIYFFGATLYWQKSYMPVYSHVVGNTVRGNLRTSPHKMCCKWEQHPWTFSSWSYFLTSLGLLWVGMVHVHDLYISIVFITIIQPKLEIWSTVIKMDKEV